MPAKPKLTPAVRARICNYVRAGSYFETAAAAAGVSGRALRYWLRAAAEARENDEKNRYTDFAEALELAQAQAEVREVGIITRAGAKDWKAAAWLLERRHSRRWAESPRHESDESRPEEIRLVRYVAKKTGEDE
jgi:hypothetical protein